MKDSEIQKAIDNCRCPEQSYCAVATTCYEPHERERTCLKCWLAYCEKNKIEIEYDY